MMFIDIEAQCPDGSTEPLTLNINFIAALEPDPQGGTIISTSTLYLTQHGPLSARYRCPLDYKEVRAMVEAARESLASNFDAMAAIARQEARKAKEADAQ